VSNSDSLPLFHSWPLFDAASRMGLERLNILGLPDPDTVRLAGQADIGVWSCDLANGDALRWSPQVYDLFGIPEGERLTRSLTVSLYAPSSRAAMEHLRAYAIQHRRGFTMDAMICRSGGDARWMRLSAMPIISEGRVVRLCGTKQDVTAEYDGPDWKSI
jgi:PAS domain S-box-containing protein